MGQPAEMDRTNAKIIGAKTLDLNPAVAFGVNFHFAPSWIPESYRLPAGGMEGAAGKEGPVCGRQSGPKYRKDDDVQICCRLNRRGKGQSFKHM